MANGVKACFSVFCVNAISILGCIAFIKYVIVYPFCIPMCMFQRLENDIG